ncbi:reverse transcriptase domain-containing protein, partial [Tanacetum coccineum]
INIVDPLSSYSETDPKVDDDHTNEEESECECDINGLFEDDKEEKEGEDNTEMEHKGESTQSNATHEVNEEEKVDEAAEGKETDESDLSRPSGFEHFKNTYKCSSDSSLQSKSRLRIAEQMGVKNLQENVDSRLAANQVNGTYIAKEADMIRYLEKVKTLTNGFRMFSIKQVPRSENKKADALSKITSTSFAHLSKQVLVEELIEKSINEVEVLAVVEEEGDTWMTPIYEYLTEETLPAEVNKARAVRRKSQRFAVINGVLYKKSFLGPWLRCVRPLQANYVLREIHEGSCSPTCPKKSATKVDPITSPWPFYKWGIDIAGPFPEGPGKVKFLIVAINYFTKWNEGKPVATITGNQVKRFVWDNIANGLVERARRSLGEGIKARLGVRSKNWMKEISHVLWAHRTKIKSSNEDTLFSLTYGTKAVIPAEIGMAKLRITEVDMVQNDEALEINLDLLEERRE